MAKSASLCSANSLTWRGVMICSASDFSSSGLRGCVSSATSSPLTRIVAGRPTLSSKSEPLRCTIWVMACLKLNAAPCGASAMGVDSEEGLSELHRLGVFHAHSPHPPLHPDLVLFLDLLAFDPAPPRPGPHPRAALHARPPPGRGGEKERPPHGGRDCEEWGGGGGGGRRHAAR